MLRPHAPRAGRAAQDWPARAVARVAPRLAARSALPSPSAPRAAAAAAAAAPAAAASPSPSRRRRCRPAAAAAAATAAPAAAAAPAAPPPAAPADDGMLDSRAPALKPVFPALNSLGLLPVVDPATGLVSGLLSAPVAQQEEEARLADAERAEAAALAASQGPAALQAFALYDAQRRLQYLGFAAPGNLRLALRALVGRRPERAHFYRAADVWPPPQERRQREEQQAAQARQEQEEREQLETEQEQRLETEQEQGGAAAAADAAAAPAAADDADADADADPPAKAAPAPVKIALAPMTPDRMAHSVMDAWCGEAGGAPPGNRLALERAAWHSPVRARAPAAAAAAAPAAAPAAAAAASSRAAAPTAAGFAGALAARREAKAAAAAATAAELLDMLRARGCEAEAFEPDPLLLAEGQVEWLPPRGSAAAAAREAAAAAAAARQADDAAADAAARLAAAGADADAAARAADLSTDEALRPRVGVAVVDGAAQQFSLAFPRPPRATKGGCILDCALTYDQAETRHQVVMGRGYYQPFGATPQQAAEVAFALMLEWGAEREPPVAGQPLPMDAFPGRYFSLTILRQYVGDAAFDDAFSALGACAAAEREGRPGAWGQVGGEPWRFQRLVPRGALAFELRATDAERRVVSGWPALSADRRREVTAQRGAGPPASGPSGGLGGGGSGMQREAGAGGGPASEGF